jgi:starvation-inducible DNA-binding protein
MKSKAKDSDLIKKLNELLSAYQVAYFNARSSHWLIKGDSFFELHKVFENVYNDSSDKIDAIAERILTLGGMPFLHASDMIRSSSIKENGINGNQAKCVSSLMEDIRSLSVIETEIAKLAQEQDDIVTADLVTKYLGEQQKLNWMLAQFLQQRSSITKVNQKVKH